jgi:predicted alpha/beta-fold hydrolase
VAGSRFEFDEQYYRNIVAADLARGMNPAANAPSASSRIDELARIQVPTLVVHGTEDPVYPYDHAQVLAKGIPTATLVSWEGVGHQQPPQLGHVAQVGVTTQRRRCAYATWSSFPVVAVRLVVSSPIEASLR